MELIVLLYLFFTVSVDCSWSAKLLTSPITIVNCPKGCQKAKGEVYGFSPYQGDSAICRAGIHAGITNDEEGGPLVVIKKPGENSYQESTRNGVESKSFGAWSESYIVSSLDDFQRNRHMYTGYNVNVQGAEAANDNNEIPSSTITQCFWSAKLITSPIAIVNCPKECQNAEGDVYGTDIFQEDSAICRAGIHAGVANNEEGGQFVVVKKPGENSYQESTRNGVVSKSHGASSGSYIVRTLDDFKRNKHLYTGYNVNFPGTEMTVEYNQPRVITETTSELPKVSANCLMKAKDIPVPVAIIECPEGCLKQNGEVWGSDIYTDESAVCRAAIHSDFMGDQGGSVILQKIQGQDSYKESTRNGVTTKAQGKWSGSFILSLSYESQSTTYTEYSYTFPQTGMAGQSKPETVSAECWWTGAQLPGPYTIIICPDGCLTQKWEVWGSKVYTNMSSLCRAAIHDGVISSIGGSALVHKMPGHNSYDGASRNGVTSKPQGQWTGSFEFSKVFDFQSTTSTEISYKPPELANQIVLEAQPETVVATCSLTGKKLTAPITIVDCANGCVGPKVNVWGVDMYTEDSVACAAATHAGVIPSTGGKFVLLKKPGQQSYEGSTKNGITSRRYGKSSGSYVLSKSYDFKTNIFTDSSPNIEGQGIKWESKQATVQASCSMTGNEITTSITIVHCPSGCMKQNANVWGIDIYTRDSAICQAAIHAGKIDNGGGSVIMKKTTGSDSYSGSSRNGVTSKQMGSWQESFEFISSLDIQSTTYTETSYNLPPTETKWEFNMPAETKWEYNMPSGQPSESKSPTETKWGFNMPSETKWEYNMPSGQASESKSPTETKWGFNMPSETKWEYNMPKGQVSESKSPTETNWGFNMPSENKWEYNMPSGQASESKSPTENEPEENSQKGFFSWWG
ncbi:uncharacterized protein LOC134569138 [Pelobates fuscus]|uniref:uncharacterized protein LOC134569138 n=1 Tax=Pelobates fuscus TaxID=191477 RepID=UPI002FE4F0C6